MVFGSIDAVLCDISLVDAADAKSHEVGTCDTDVIVASALSTTY